MTLAGPKLGESGPLKTSERDFGRRNGWGRRVKKDIVIQRGDGAPNSVCVDRFQSRAVKGWIKDAVCEVWSDAVGVFGG